MTKLRPEGSKKAVLVVGKLKEANAAVGGSQAEPSQAGERICEKHPGWQL